MPSITSHSLDAVPTNKPACCNAVLAQYQPHRQKPQLRGALFSCAGDDAWRESGQAQLDAVEQRAREHGGGAGGCTRCRIGGVAVEAEEVWRMGRSEEGGRGLVDSELRDIVE